MSATHGERVEESILKGQGIVVRVVRGTEAESFHLAHGVVVGLRDGEEIQFGRPGTLTFWRSAFKPFQVLPVVEDGVAAAFGFEAADLALCCASHRGTAAHLKRVAAMLERLGLGEDALECGAQPPLDEEAALALARTGRGPGPLHNNCSGKHIGMLALALHHGWPTQGYVGPDHPVQVRIRRMLASWVDIPPRTLSWAGDGCGVPTPYLSLRQMGRAYARFGRSGEPEVAAVVAAMTGHPELVSGLGGLSTEIMRATEGRILAKGGAEGVFCATAPGEGWGCALKVVDGGQRAVGPALLEMLIAAEVLRASEAERLEALRLPPVSDARGQVVGRLMAQASPRVATVAGRL